ncbi:hypothetical protein PRIPAC_77890 [Pristionchus pacificus]|uniref:Uncharacterized protein n=1 Tax=Pristionchus pacificus TaxID=54126 RepID=A0A2A6CPX1_PRIPA|nr:hypothetical protein PRIPAC_77890 [Pristionchus pacificus]|eukprot:PDM80189.1 hypothetical protein PRIPAC_32768 [Pristionchus pacificus]
MQATFNKNDPKYHYLCCCGAHVSTIARVLIVLDLIPLEYFFYISIGIAYGCGVYGVFKQSRTPLLVHTILGGGG